MISFFFCQIQPHVRIWDSVSLQTLHVVGVGEFERSVACLSFSAAVSSQTLYPSFILTFFENNCVYHTWLWFFFPAQDGGALLCAVDEAPDHNISIWDWQRGERGHKMVETKVSQRTMNYQNIYSKCDDDHIIR